MSDATDARGPSARSTEIHLSRITRLDPQLKAMMCVDAVGARADAQRADEASTRGQWLGLLHGLPMVVKDNIDTASLPTTCGSRFFEQRRPNQDAPVVARLRAAGAVILGKASLHEFAFGVRGNNPLRGQCQNPWNTTRIPGGSSGGSAAAVAAGLCAAALGSDTGGSVRLPSAFTGISGLRPSVGRVSNAGSMPVCPSQDTIGPMARSVSDLARIFAVIAAAEPVQPSASVPPLENFLPTLDQGIAGVRIGLPRNHYFDSADASIAKAVLAAAAVLEAQGAILVDVDVPGAEAVHHWASVVIFSDACAVHAQRLADAPERFDPEVLARMRTGLDYTGVDYAQAMQERQRWRHRLGQVFAQVDLILSPTVHVPVPLIDDGRSLLDATRNATRNTYAGAFGQIPGLSVPCGFHPDGMPIGLQLEAPWWHEPRLLQAGYCYQQHTDWHQQRPPTKC